jgi:F-type H+-transporting ATPase subunit alpha
MPAIKMDKKIEKKTVAKKIDLVKKGISKAFKQPRFWLIAWAAWKGSMLKERGTVIAVKDTVAFIRGLSGVYSNELLFFWGWGIVTRPSMFGVALNLEKELVKGLAFGNSNKLMAGTRVVRSFRVLYISMVWERALGRILDPLGNTLDGLDKKKGSLLDTFDGAYFGSRHNVFSNIWFPTSNIEVKAPGVITRSKVNEALETGIKTIDTMIPIGRGQRELIIGDKKTGKTTIAIDTILQQKQSFRTPICIYVAIGKRMAEVVRIAKLLEKRGSWRYSIIIASRASDPASLQYIAPYAGCTIAEAYMRYGFPTLVIYDDLSRHADVYRQIALLLRRPVGREAYPGDVFYLHSRLLERSSKLRAKEAFAFYWSFYAKRTLDYMKNSVASTTSDSVIHSFDLYGRFFKSFLPSQTALPIVETLQGDVSAYIPTNIISITDGQIYLDVIRHQEGLRPAVDPGISVSRIGSAAQGKLMKSVAGSLKLSLAMFREVEGFVKVGLDLDAVTRKVLEHGLRITEILKQPKHQPWINSDIAICLLALNMGLLDNVPAASISVAVTDLLTKARKIGFLVPFFSLVATLNKQGQDDLKEALSCFKHSAFKFN